MPLAMLSKEDASIAGGLKTEQNTLTKFSVGNRIANSQLARSAVADDW
jgi:hypothetical protein